MVSAALRISDNHGHANPVRGLGPREVARRFRRTGGWFMVLVSLLTWDLGLTPGSMSSVERLYEITTRSAQEASGEGVRAVAVVGLHPAECVRLIEAGWGFEEVRGFMYRSIDLAARYITEGRAVGIGEVGRPHWQVDGRIIELCNDIIRYAVERAKDVGGVVHLHLERNGRATVESISRLANEANVDWGFRRRIILHHASPDMVKPAVEHGLTASIPIGRRGEFEEAIRNGAVFVVESDYIDDPRRPGAVIPQWRIAARVMDLLRRGVVDEGAVEKIMVDNIVELYGVECC